MKTLMIHTGGIGDFILTCPAIKAISKNSDITLAGSTDRLNLAVDAGIAESAIGLDTVDFHSLFATPSEILVAFLRPFGQIIVWMRDNDHTIRRTLETIASASVQVFPGLPPDDWTDHASEYYRSCLDLPELPPIRLTLRERPIVHDIILHPGSGSDKKNWPLERFQALAHTLEKSGRIVTWCKGPAEVQNIPQMPAQNTLQCDSLTELARHLSGATQYIGNDSGITHLAAALHTPTMALFAPTDPAIWAPRGKHVKVIHKKGWATVREVKEALNLARRTGQKNGVPKGI